MKYLLTFLFFLFRISVTIYGQNSSDTDRRDPIRFLLILLVIYVAWLVFLGIESWLINPKLKKYVIYLQSAALFCFAAGIFPSWLDSLFHPIPTNQWLLTLMGASGLVLFIVAAVISQKRWRQNQVSLRHHELKLIVQELFRNGKNVDEAYMVLNAPIDDVQYGEIPFAEIEAIYDELQRENPNKSDFGSDLRPKS